MPKPTIVLVHGAWADGSSWNAVSTELQSQGFTVLTPPNLLRGVAGDAAYIASFLAQRTSGPVVLVGHSYGGVVITNAGTGGGDVKALVYVDAFIPDVGETVLGILSGSGSALEVADPTAVLDIVGYPGSPGRRCRSVPQALHRARFVRAGPRRGRPVVDRRESASGRPRRQRRADPDRRVEDHPELGGRRNRGPRHPAGHATLDGGTGGRDDHRSGWIARLDGVASGRRDRRDPRRGRQHRRVGADLPGHRERVSGLQIRGRGVLHRGDDRVPVGVDFAASR